MNNPTATLPRRAVKFCLAVHRDDAQLICTRIDDHGGHCCDEVSQVAWEDRFRPHVCGRGYDHSNEKRRAA